MYEYLNHFSNYTDRWSQTYPIQAPGVLLLLVGSTANAITKVVASALALLPYNSKSKLNKWAHRGFKATFGAEHILPSLLFLATRFFNPYSKGFYDSELEKEISQVRKNDKIEIIDILLKKEIFEGTLTKFAHNIFKEAIEAANKTKDRVGDTIDLYASGLFLAGTVAIFLAKSLELIAGLAFGSAALLTLGNYSKINQLAMHYLASLNVIDEVLAGVLAIINPWRDHLHMETLWHPEQYNIFNYV